MLDSTFNRYNSLSAFLKDKFGCKVYKVSLNGSFSCPNRDGTKGIGGCIYCNPEGNWPLISRGKTIPDQLLEGIAYAKKRHHGTTKFISYFQHYSNTYADTALLKKLYYDAISHPDVVGLAVSTRPDCLTNETLKLLKQLNSETFLWLELGLQSANDKTLKTLNRGHTSKEFANALNMAHDFGIMTCAHIILGLPGEVHDDMMNTMEFLNKLEVGGVKIHNLHILKNTRLAELEVKTLSLMEYASLVVDCLERLAPSVLIHRFNSHAPRHLTIAPDWSINKLATLNAVHDEIKRRDTYQGRIFTPAP